MVRSGQNDSLLADRGDPCRGHCNCGKCWVAPTQLEIWQANKELGFIDGAPSFSTADAPFFLRYARLNKAGSGIPSSSIRLYPNRTDLAEEAEPDTSIFDWPLISIAIVRFLDKQ